MVTICFVSNLYYCAGYTESVCNYVKVARAIGIDVILAGFIDDRVVPFLIENGARLGERRGPVQGLFDSGDDYLLSKQLMSNCELIVVLFDNGNFYDERDYPGALKELLDVLPRDRTIVFDADGKYNTEITCEGDKNHDNRGSMMRWHRTIDRLSSRVFQPTLTPRDKRVRSFVFWGYAEPTTRALPMYDIFYLGSNWFRMSTMKQFLSEVENLRGIFPSIAVWGKNWRVPDKYWPSDTRPDIQFFETRNIDLRETQVTPGSFVQTVGLGSFSPILIRPVLASMEMITPRVFETFASGAIPIIPSGLEYLQRICGSTLEELSLSGDIQDTLIRMGTNLDYYRDVVETVRVHMRESHSYERKLNDLLDIADSL